MTAAAEASLYSGEPSTGVLFNVIVVSQLLVVRRYPLVAPFCCTVDLVAAALIAVEILAGVL